jgi:hypothetical protein
MIALQAFGIVVDAQAALDAVGLQFVALAPAERAGLGDADGHQRQAVRAQAALRETDALPACMGGMRRSGLSLP